MAKAPKQLKRSLDRSGNVRYFYGGKRISDKKGRTKFVKTNYQQIRDRQIKVLTESEVKTFHRAQAQRSLDRFRGRPVPKTVSYVYRNILKSVGKDPVDFAKIQKDGKPVFKRYSDILRAIDFAQMNFPLTFSIETSRGLPGFRNREQLTSVTDIVEKFQGPVFSGFKLRVRLPEFMGSQDITGRVHAFEAIMQFETIVSQSVMESDRENVSFIRYTYYPAYDFKDQLATFDLRLKKEFVKEHARDFADLEYNGASVDVMTSDPIKRTK